MKRTGRILAVLLSIVVGACSVDDIWQASISRGSVRDGVYSNMSLWIRTSVPAGWHQLNDSTLDAIASNAAVKERKENPHMRVHENLVLYIFVNPTTRSFLDLECSPLYLYPKIQTLKDFADFYLSAKNTALFEQGSDRQVQVEWLDNDNTRAVKFTTDQSAADKTLITIEVIRFKNVGSNKLIISHAAAVRDSTDLPLIDSLLASYRETSIVGL